MKLKFFVHLALLGFSTTLFATSTDRSLGILYLSKPGQAKGEARAYTPSGRLMLTGDSEASYVAMESDARQLFSKALKRRSAAPGDLGSGYPGLSKKWAEFVKGIPCPVGKLRIFVAFNEGGGDAERGYEWGISDVEIKCAGASFPVEACTRSTRSAGPKAFFNEAQFLNIFRECQAAMETAADGGAEGSDKKEH